MGWDKGPWGKNSQLCHLAAEGMLLALCFNEIYFHFALLCFLVPRKNGKQSSPVFVRAVLGDRLSICAVGRSDVPPGLSLAVSTG